MSFNLRVKFLGSIFIFLVIFFGIFLSIETFDFQVRFSVANSAELTTQPANQPYNRTSKNQIDQESFCNDFLSTNPTLRKKLSIPAFYRNAVTDSAVFNEPHFDLYYWTQQPFHPEWKTLVFIPGGPGQTYHQQEWQDIPHINFLYFDPRGTGCSTPLSESLKQNSDFYSSELIAKDLLALKNKLKIKTWSLYAHSYGTIPATIFSSQFPNSVEKLFLEGTVTTGKTSFWTSSARADILQKIFTQLEPGLKNRLIENFTTDPDGSFWFSQFAQERIASGLDKDRFNSALETRLKFQNLRIADKNSAAGIQNHSFSPLKIKDHFPFFSKDFYIQISCKELSMQKISVSRLFKFTSNSTQGTTDNFVFWDAPDYQNQCSTLNLNLAPSSKNDLNVNDNATTQTYNFENYPLKVPTIYFQGEYDYQTPTKDSYKHFIYNQSKKKRFIILNGEGHNSLTYLFNSAKNTSNSGEYFNNSPEIDGLSVKDFFIKELNFKSEENQ